VHLAVNLDEAHLFTDGAGENPWQDRFIAVAMIGPQPGVKAQKLIILPSTIESAHSLLSLSFTFP
jgi:hypothetical protein